MSDEWDDPQREPARVPGQWEARAEEEGPRPWWLPSGEATSPGDATLHDEAPTVDRIPIVDEGDARRTRPRSMQLVALFLAALLGAGVGTGVTLAVRDEGPASASAVRVAQPPAGGALPGGVASV